MEKVKLPSAAEIMEKAKFNKELAFEANKQVLALQKSQRNTAIVKGVLVCLTFALTAFLSAKN